HRRIDELGARVTDADDVASLTEEGEPRRRPGEDHVSLAGGERLERRRATGELRELNVDPLVLPVAEGGGDRGQRRVRGVLEVRGGQEPDGRGPLAPT